MENMVNVIGTSLARLRQSDSLAEGRSTTLKELEKSQEEVAMEFDNLVNNTLPTFAEGFKESVGALEESNDRNRDSVSAAIHTLEQVQSMLNGERPLPSKEEKENMQEAVTKVLKVLGGVSNELGDDKDLLVSLIEELSSTTLLDLPIDLSSSYA